MSGGGGKGGSQTQTTQMDPALTAAARDGLDMAAAAAAIPYSPNRGVQIASFTPQQKAAFAGADAASGAFGLGTVGPAAMPEEFTTASGIKGYKTGADFDEMRDASYSAGLQGEIAKLFADPETGAFSGPGGSLKKSKYADMPGVASLSSGGK